jgi:hypothetical protein
MKIPAKIIADLIMSLPPVNKFEGPRIESIPIIHKDLSTVGPISINDLPVTGVTLFFFPNYKTQEWEMDIPKC